MSVGKWGLAGSSKHRPYFSRLRIDIKSNSFKFFGPTVICKEDRFVAKLVEHLLVE